MDKEQQVTEVRETNDRVGDTSVSRQSVSTASAAPSSLVAARVVWFIAGIFIALLGLRIAFLLLGANQGSPFVDLIYGLSYPLAWPFFGIFSYQPSYGVSTLEISSLVAIAVYALIAWGLVKLFTLGSTRRDVV